MHLPLNPIKENLTNSNYPRCRPFSIYWVQLRLTGLIGLIGLPLYAPLNTRAAFIASKSQLKLTESRKKRLIRCVQYMFVYHLKSGQQSPTFCYQASLLLLCCFYPFFFFFGSCFFNLLLSCAKCKCIRAVNVISCCCCLH